MYSLDIVVEEDHIREHESIVPKPLMKSVLDKLNIRIRFTTEEEKEKYIKGEYLFTKNQLKEHAAAWTKEDRIKAKVKLYLARRAYHNQYFSKDDERQTA